MTTIIKGSTKRGQSFIESAKRNCGTDLSHIYKSYSYEKICAFDYCRQKFVDTVNARNFHIYSYSSYSFNVAWYGEYIYNDIPEWCLFIEISCNSYVILLNR